MKLHLTLVALLTVCPGLSPLLAQLSPGHPLAGLERLKSFEAMRASSSDPNWRDGNHDARPIAPGQTLVLAELEGPGVITHIWNTIAHEASSYSRLMTLRIYWDGEEHPSVEAPIGDFFGVGHGVDRAFTSLPVKVSSNGRARNCYWPMPFRKSAKITVTNDSDRRCGAFYYYVDWQKHAALPEDTAYFHAMYRQEYPCVMGRNYLVADIVGRGHYVGTVQSVQMMSAGWYGEGDDFFFVDGETEPRLRGTGTEDYFCDAWGFVQQDGPFYGTPLWEGFEAGNRGSAYRWHIPDPIPFSKSLRVEIEHKGSQHFADGTSTGFIERDDLMSSVAFWYQLDPHKPWPPMPPATERLATDTRVVVVGWRAVARARHSGHPLQVQPMPGIAKEDGKQLWFTPTDDQGWLEIRFRLDAPVEANLWVKPLQAPDYGIYRVRLDGREVGLLDLYHPEVRRKPMDLGRQSVSAGEHVLRFECAGKNENSRGYFLGLDSVALVRGVYERPPGFDLRKIQKQP